MMDLALLTANANQLRYVLASHSEGSMYYHANIVLISGSIILQVHRQNLLPCRYWLT